jgi:signal transduction histidine kinase
LGVGGAAAGGAKADRVAAAEAALTAALSSSSRSAAVASHSSSTSASSCASLLAFADTGSGIKPENLARLFEPYHTTKPGGHGLGMMVVQRILREHGGQIAVESNPGRGTTVTLQFPLKQRRVRLLKS